MYIKFRFSLSVACFIVLMTGCGSQSTSSSSSVSFLDQPMTQAEIDSLAAGDQAFAMVEREDGIRFVPITLGSRYTSGSYDYLTFRDGEAKFGFGDSGSPILNREGKTIGALSGTFGGDNVVITPISNMMSAVGQSYKAAPSGTVSNKLAWFASGVNADGRAKLRSAGIPVLDFDLSPVLSKAASEAAAGDSTYTVAPGRSMAVLPFDGPIVKIFAIGTATHQVDADKMIAFGHSLNWDGQPNFSMPVTPAKLIQFVHDPLFGSFKLAVPVGNIEGGIVQDRSTAIMISRTANIQWVGVTVNAGGKTTSHRLCRIDNQDLQPYFLIVGIENIVQRQLDTGNPGLLKTTITITYDDTMTNTIDMGSLDWYSVGWQVWNSISTDFSRITKIEVTVS